MKQMFYYIQHTPCLSRTKESMISHAFAQNEYGDLPWYASRGYNQDLDIEISFRRTCFFLFHWDVGHLDELSQDDEDMYISEGI